MPTLISDLFCFVSFRFVFVKALSGVHRQGGRFDEFLSERLAVSLDEEDVDEV